MLLLFAACGQKGEESAMKENGENIKQEQNEVGDITPEATPEPTKVGIPPVPTLTQAPTPTEEEKKEEEDTRTKEEIYNDMIARSFLSAGNNYRIKKVLWKRREMGRRY